MADYWADGEPPSGNGLLEAGPVWGMTFGYPVKAIGLPSSTFSSSHTLHFEVGHPLLFCEFSPFIKKKNFRILFSESPWDYLSCASPLCV